MNIILPNNVFTRVLSSCFPEETKIKFLPSSQITQKIENDNSSIGLIPVMDLLNHKDLFVSNKFGISFESSLCNSYIYYNSQENSINRIALAGDISSQEVILSKILFKEVYGSDIEIEIITDMNKSKNKNLLLVGDDNFIDDKFTKGISFSEIFVDALSIPLVNYLFASTNREELENLIKKLNDVDNLFYSTIENGNFDKKFSTASEEYIKKNISSFIFKFDEQDREGVEQILRLPYFHGITKDIVELKLI